MESFGPAHFERGLFDPDKLIIFNAMNYDLQIILTAAIGFALGYLSQWAELMITRRIYKNRRRKLAKMKYA